MAPSSKHISNDDFYDSKHDISATDLTMFIDYQEKEESFNVDPELEDEGKYWIKVQKDHLSLISKRWLFFSIICLIVTITLLILVYFYSPLR